MRFFASLSGACTAVAAAGRCLGLLLASWLLVSGESRAAPMIVRDAEVESIIRAGADPVFRAAGIPPESVVVSILSDPTLNAFVTTGNRMYIHSGLLLKTATPNQLIGVIAHETGHIAGGHMARVADEIAKARMASMLSLALGVAAAAATGRGDVALAATALGQDAAAKSFFSYSRTQESSADAFALRLLDKMTLSAKGLLDFFKMLQGQEYMSSGRQDPYTRTHPLTEERVEAIRTHVEQSSIPTTIAPSDQARHDRMVAKLSGFIEPQARVLQRYRPDDGGVPARYARSIAFYRRGDLTKALPLIDGLIAEAPNDPYFHELRGQMLVESGRISEGLVSYSKAAALAPHEILISISYGHALIEQGGVDNLGKAQVILKKAVQKEPENSFAWQLLGTALGRAGDESRASYALAEYALLAGDNSLAVFHAEKAARALGRKDPLWFRLQDIIREAGGEPDREAVSSGQR